jgi:hypothetical protein
MSKSIAVLDESPDFLQQSGMSELTKQLAGSGGGGVKRIVPKNGIFRKIVGGDEVGKLKGDLNVVIVNASPAVSRIYYSKPWTPESEPTAPDCFSNDGRQPDPQAVNPQGTRCDTCPMNIKGSGQGQSKACRYSRRLAVVLEDDFGTALEGEVYQINLASKSLFGESPSDRAWTFENYVKYLASNGKSIDWFVTQMSFNEDNDNQSLLFSPVRHISREEFAVTGKLGAKDEIKRLVIMTPYQADVSGRKALEAPAKKAEVEVVAEPVKRESKVEAKAAPAPKKGLDDVVKAWSEDD